MELERVNVQLQHEVRERQRGADELARSNAELEQFASAASHDLQEPLRMIVAFTQLLAKRYRGQVDTDGEDYLDFILDAATRMRALIQELLAYARVSQGDLVTEPVPLDETLRHTLRVLEAPIQETGATIRWDPLPTVQANATQLGQVFQNLVSNALKYRGEATPRIHVTARPRGRSGSLRCRIMAWGWRRRMRNGSSRSFNGCIHETNTPARASGWHSAKKSSNGMAVGSGWSRNPGRGQHSISPSHASPRRLGRPKALPRLEALTSPHRSAEACTSARRRDARSLSREPI